MTIDELLAFASALTEYEAAHRAGDTPVKVAHAHVMATLAARHDPRAFGSRGFSKYELIADYVATTRLRKDAIVESVITRLDRTSTELAVEIVEEMLVGSRLRPSQPAPVAA